MGAGVGYCRADGWLQGHVGKGLAAEMLVSTTGSVPLHSRERSCANRACHRCILPQLLLYNAKATHTPAPSKSSTIYLNHPRVGPVVVSSTFSPLVVCFVIIAFFLVTVDRLTRSCVPCG